MAVRSLDELEKLYTPEEYLELERCAECKSEYVNGEIVAMSGARLPHNRIQVNLTREVSNQLRDTPCEPFGSDMRVRTSAAHYCYPDLSIVCGRALLEDRQRDTLLNPVLVIEILSPSTARYDREMKFERYKRLESLREYVLVAQDKPRIERFLRTAEGWNHTLVEGIDQTITFESINVSLMLSRVYERIEFAAA